MLEKQFRILVDLAKKYFGEYKEEILGYELMYCDGYENYYSEEILQANDLLNVKDDFYGIPNAKDIEDRLNSNQEYFWYDNHTYAIIKRFKVINKGWKMEIIELIQSL